MVVNAKQHEHVQLPGAHVQGCGRHSDNNFQESAVPSAIIDSTPQYDDLQLMNGMERT